MFKGTIRKERSKNKKRGGRKSSNGSDNYFCIIFLVLKSREKWIT